MQPIHVSRYEQPKAVGYQGTITPQDRSWILWVDVDGNPSLWRRVLVAADPSIRAKQGIVATPADAEPSGDTIEAYVPDVVFNWPPGTPVPEHLVHMFGDLPVGEESAQR